MLTGKHVRQLDRDGFCVIDRLLSPARALRLIDQLSILPSEPQATRIKRGVAFARRNLLEMEWVVRFANHPGIQRMLCRVSPGLRVVRAILFDKTGAANWTVPWHQDRSIAVAERIEVDGFGPWSQKAGIPHVQPPTQILRQMLTLRVHLDACDASNGPLRVAPGTHQTILDLTEIEAREKTGDITCVTGIGGAVLMRPLILHASSPAKLPRHRRVLHLEFGPKHLPGGLAWALGE